MKKPFSVVIAMSLLVLAGLLFPPIGYCDSGSGWLSNIFKSSSRNTEVVAVKLAELPEKYNFVVTGLDFNPSGELVAVLSTEQTIRIWDWKKDRIVRDIKRSEGANDGSTTELIKFSPDGRWFAACHQRAANDVVIRIWNVDTWEIAHDIIDATPGGCSAIGFTPDGKLLLRAADRNPSFPADSLVVYDTETWKPIWGIPTTHFYPSVLAISPDGKFVAIGGEVIIPITSPPSTPKPNFINNIAIVDMEQRSIVRTIPDTISFTFGQLAWSSDGLRLTGIGKRAWDGAANHGMGEYTGGPDNIMIFDPNSGKQLAGDEWGPISWHSLRYTPDGKFLIEGDRGNDDVGLGARIWDAQRRELLQTIPGSVGGLAVSRDGHYFAVGNKKKTTVWEFK